MEVPVGTPEPAGKHRIRQPPFNGPFPGLRDYCATAVPTSDGWVLGGGRNRILVAVSDAATSVGGDPVGDGVVKAGAGELHLAASPNPFNPTTALSFRLAGSERVRLSIYDLQGRLVRRLVDETRGAGEHLVRWDGRDEGGRAVAAGVYPVQLQAGDTRSSARIVLIR